MSVIVPGSYDPVTLGHLDIIRRASEMYDEVFVVVFINPEKEYSFSLSDRVSMLMLATAQLDNVLVSYSLGRVVDYMREHNIEKIIKGIRNESDLAYERVQEEYNLMHGGYPTEYLCRRFRATNSNRVLLLFRLPLRSPDKALRTIILFRDFYAEDLKNIPPWRR